ncbi:MAG: helix-turn-helix domain-containing protein [Vallitaleaceae bacterium]|nr:helix-turn-helix domain-containing protein [Vallitaleaceae bacterium]
MEKLLFRAYKTNENFVFNIEKCPLVGDFLEHTHDFCELVIILKGTAIHIVNGREYMIKSGDAFIIQGDLSHGYKNVNNLEYINIMFNHSMVQQPSLLKKNKGFQALFYIEPFYRREQNFSSKLVLTPAQLKKVEAVADLLIDEQKQNLDTSQAMIGSYFTVLLIMLSRNYGANINEDNRKVLQMAEAVTYIEENYLKNINLSQLSELACLSSRHFVRVFKKNYKITPMDYIIQLRLNYSATLLKETSMPISMVATESGFNDHNYYSRKFREVFEVSPTIYRTRDAYNE